MIDVSSTIACPECGRLHRYQPIAPGKTATCQRCGTVLYRNRRHMIETVLALTVAGLFLFFLSNFYPLLGLSAQRIEQDLHLLGASVALWGQGYQLLAALIVLNTIVFPFFELVSLLVISLTVKYRWKPEMAIFLFRWMREIKPWGMLEVFMLGILVSVVKLGDVATLIVGTAFWSFSGLIITMAAASSMLEPFTVWQVLGRCREREHAVAT